MGFFCMWSACSQVSSQMACKSGKNEPLASFPGKRSRVRACPNDPELPMRRRRKVNAERVNPHRPKDGGETRSTDQDFQFVAVAVAVFLHWYPNDLVVSVVSEINSFPT